MSLLLMVLGVLCAALITTGCGGAVVETATSTPEKRWGITLTFDDRSLTNWILGIPEVWRNPDETHARYHANLFVIETVVESCDYFPLGTILRKRYDVRARLTDLETSEIIDEIVFAGTTPEVCRNREEFEIVEETVERIGDLPERDEFNDWILGLVLEQETDLITLTPSITPTPTNTRTPTITRTPSPTSSVTFTPSATPEGKWGLYLTMTGDQIRDAWTNLVPIAWRNPDQETAAYELIVRQSSRQVERCDYAGNKTFYSRQISATIELMNRETGGIIAESEYLGGVPPACPFPATFGADERSITRFGSLPSEQNMRRWLIDTVAEFNLAFATVTPTPTRTR